MGESRLIVEELLALCLQRITMEENSVNTEQEVIEVVKNFETVRRRWLHAEVELKKYKELLVKSDVAKAALEVKLKHARNQLDVEMKKRYKIEGDYQYLQRQMQLMCDILVHDTKSNACLNDEQKSLLAAFEHKGGNVTLHKSTKRLSVIDESSFLSHSDISYDRTDDDVDLDTTVIKPLRSRAREKRRSSMGPAVGVPAGKRGRGGNMSAELLERKTVDKVIRPETCSPCGKRIRFGKMAVKCRNCRVVVHPECKQKCSDGCLATTMAGSAAQQNLLEGFAPVIHPRVPLLIVECVTEIERRGLEERGLYRVPGGERLVKEFRDRFIQGKTPLMLSKVHDIHVVCGLLKDFLRKLKEPLITFRLHRTFMEASELADEDNSAAIIYHAIAELPKANRDTLAFLMLHLQKVMKSPKCQMDQNNLARVFGPTIVGHGMSEPSPTTIMRDTTTQPKVICRLLSLPEAYWRSLLAVQTDQISSLSSTTMTYSQDVGHGRLFKPLTSPELNSYYKTPSRGSLRGRIRNLGHALTSTGRAEPGRRFFTSPS